MSNNITYKKIIPALAVITLIIGGFAWLFSSDSNSDSGVLESKKYSEAYKIGVISPLTGDGSALGQPYVNGMQLAADEINNNGGINGREVELKVQDSKFDSIMSADAANFLINVEQVDTLSNIFFLPSQASSEIAKISQTPFLYQAFPYSIQRNNPYAIKMNFDPVTGCKAMTNFLKQEVESSNLGILVAEVEYGDLCIQGIKEVAPDFKEYRYNFGDTDFEAILKKIDSDNVDNLMMLGIDFEFLAVFTQLESLGLDIEIACVTASECASPAVLESVDQQYLQGVYGVDYINFLDNQDFKNKYKQKYGSQITSDLILGYGAVGYDEVQIIASSLEKCNPGEKVCILENLKNVSVDQYDNSAIGSLGIKDRILQTEDKIYQFDGSRWQKAD